MIEHRTLVEWQLPQLKGKVLEHRQLQQESSRKRNRERATYYESN